MSDYQPDPSKPIQGPFRDEQGRMYYVRQNGDKSYVSPAAQGPGHNVPGDDGGVFHHRSEWNQDTGEYEKNMNWGNILSMVVAGALTVGAATAMMGGSAAAEEMATATATAGAAPPAAEVAAAEAAAAGGASAGPSLGGAASLAGEGGAAVSTAKEVSNLLDDGPESEFDGVDMGTGSDDPSGDGGGGGGGDSSTGDSGTDRIKSALSKLGLSGKDIAKLVAGGGLGALSALLAPKKHSFWGEKDSTGQSVDPRDVLGEGLSKNRSTFDALSKQIGEGVTLPSSFVQQPGSASGGGHSFGLSGLDPALSDPGLLHLKGLDVSGKGLPPQTPPAMPAGAPGPFNGLPGGNQGPTLREPARPPVAPGAAPTLRPLPSGPQMRLDSGGGDDMEKAKAAFKMMGVKV